MDYVNSLCDKNEPSIQWRKWINKLQWIVSEELTISWGEIAKTFLQKILRFKDLKVKKIIKALEENLGKGFGIMGNLMIKKLI